MAEITWEQFWAQQPDRTETGVQLQWKWPWEENLDPKELGLAMHLYVLLSQEHHIISYSFA